MVQDQWSETCVSQACAPTVWMRAGEDGTAFKMVRLCVCTCVPLTMTCLVLKRQRICFHGLRQGWIQWSPLQCFTPGCLSDYEHPEAAFNTAGWLPSRPALHTQKYFGIIKTVKTKKFNKPLLYHFSVFLKYWSSSLLLHVLQWI